MSNSGEVDTSKSDTINAKHNTLVEPNIFHVLDMYKPPILELYKKIQRHIMALTHPWPNMEEENIIWACIYK
jgi:hypothetical protein